MEKMFEKYFQQCIKCFIKFMKKCAESRKNCKVETIFTTFFRRCELNGTLSYRAKPKLKEITNISLYSVIGLT